MPREVTGKNQLTPPIFIAKIKRGVRKKMSIKLAILKSGEDIIADIHEMVVGEEENEKTIGYFFTKPCVVNLG